MLTDPEVIIESKIKTLENQQIARRTNWMAEDAKLESFRESRRANWISEQTSRDGKIEALRGKLLAKREARFAAEKAEEVRLANMAAGEARRAAFYAKSTSTAVPPLLQAPDA